MKPFWRRKSGEGDQPRQIKDEGRSTLYELADSFRRAACMGNAEGDVLLSQDVIALEPWKRQEVLDQIAVDTGDPCGDGSDFFQGRVFCLRAVWGWAIDHYEDNNMERLVLHALDRGRARKQEEETEPVFWEETHAVLRVWKIRDFTP